MESPSPSSPLRAQHKSKELFLPDVWNVHKPHRSAYNVGWGLQDIHTLSICSKTNICWEASLCSGVIRAATFHTRCGTMNGVAENVWRWPRMSRRRWGDLLWSYSMHTPSLEASLFSYIKHPQRAQTKCVCDLRPKLFVRAILWSGAVGLLVDPEDSFASAVCLQNDKP